MALTPTLGNTPGPTYTAQGGSNDSGIIGALSQLGFGSSGLSGSTNALAQQQAATAAQNANTRAGYGIQGQQVGNDLAHTLAGYNIDANNLEIQQGTYNRQGQQLDLQKGIAQQQNALDLANIAANQQIQNLQYQNQQAQTQSQNIANGAPNAVGYQADRANAIAQQAQQNALFGNQTKKAGLDWQTYLNTYLGQRADIADQMAHLGNDVRALGNNEDAAKTSAALQQRAIANNAAGVGIGSSGGGGGGGGGGFGSGGGGGGLTGNVMTNYTPAQRQAAAQQLMTNLSNPVQIRNVGNRNNPLGVTDDTWNQMIFLATLQAGGVQGAQSLQNLQNLMRMVGAAQQQNAAGTSQPSGAGTLSSWSM